MWVQLQGVGVVGDGIGELAEAVKGATAVVIGTGILWVQLQGVRVVGDGIGESA